MHHHVNELKNVQHNVLKDHKEERRSTLKFAEANQILGQLKKKFTDSDINTFINYSKLQLNENENRQGFETLMGITNENMETNEIQEPTNDVFSSDKESPVKISKKGSLLTKQLSLEKANLAQQQTNYNNYTKETTKGSKTNNELSKYIDVDDCNNNIDRVNISPHHPMSQYVIFFDIKNYRPKMT